MLEKIKQRNHRMYYTWKGMKQRCYNPKHKQYKHYGNRGISICDEWKNSFSSFVHDMYPSFVEGLTIDRIDNNGNYEPSNCRWATSNTQRRNTRPIMSTNTSGYRGICFNKINNKWIAQIRINKKAIYLGSFISEIDAALAYNNYIELNKLEHTKNTLPPLIERVAINF